MNETIPSPPASVSGSSDSEALDLVIVGGGLAGGLLALAPFFNLLGLVILVRRVSRRIRERASSSALRRYQVVLAASFCVFPSTVVFREYRAAGVDAAELEAMQRRSEPPVVVVPDALGGEPPDLAAVINRAFGLEQ